MPIRTRACGLVVLLAFAASCAGGAEAASDPTGTWLNDTGRGAIEIKDCGGKLCGHVVWVKDETDSKGCGRQIIGEASPVSTGLWDNGWIYSPERKRRYDVELKPLADGTLRVKGYAGTKLFSKTMIWTKAPTDLVRCDATQLAKADPAQPAAPAPVLAPAPVPAPSAKAEPPASSDVPPLIEPKVAATPPPPAVAGKPVEGEKPNPDNPDAAPPAAATKDNKETKTAEAEDEPDNGGPVTKGLVDKLGEIERETGYGIKETSPGHCRLKVPFATVTFKCND